MTELRVVYDDFSGGEYGAPGGAHAPDNSFTGRNVLVYRNGLIGPRPGVKTSTTPGAAGIIANMWRGIRDGSVADADVWFVTTGGMVTFAKRSPSSYTFNAGALTGAVTTARAPQAVHIGLGKYILTNFLDRTYVVDLTQTSGVGTPLVSIGTPGCSTIAVYGDRVFIGNDGTTTGFRRIWYTDAGSIASFPAANFFDVGGRSGVAALVGQRDHLAILMEDGSWWIYRGSGTSASLRKVTSAEWPNWTLNQNCVANLADDEIVELTSLGDWPATFDGVSLDHLYQHGPDGDGTKFSNTADVKVARGLRPHEAGILLPDTTNGARLYLNRDNIWTIHTLPTNIASAISSVGTGAFMLVNNATPHVFYEFDCHLDRPAFTSDTLARPGDLSDTPLSAFFTLPEWWSKPGTDVRVRQVIVDFIKYQTGATAPTTNNITLNVTAFGMFGNDGVETASSQSWTEEGASAPAGANGTRDRVTFNVGEQGWGAGFQIGLSALRGVAVKTITVALDTEPSTPRL